MTALPARRVRRLVLAAPNDDLITRGRVLIEDALRTASLPSVEPGRVLVVRRLNLGSIAAAASPSTIAIVVEKQLSEARLRAVHVDAPGADLSPAVYFRDATEAVVVLGVRLARHADLSSWYWPLVVPGWRPDLTRESAWRLVVRRLVDAPAAVLQLAAALESSDTLHEMLQALQPEDGAALISAFGWSTPASSDVAFLRPAVAPVVHVGPRWSPVVRHWLPVWGLTDPRSAWLAAMSVAVEHPAVLADPHLPQRALAVVGPLASPPVRQLDPPPAAHSVVSRRVSESPPVSSVAERGASVDEPAPTAASASPVRASADPTDDEPVRAEPLLGDPEVDRTWPDPRWPQDPLPTAFGGFYFLLPVLNRLGLNALLEQQPELLDADFPNHLLRHAAQRLRIPLDDPILLPVMDPSASAPDPELVPLLQTWFGTMRRWTRQNARIGLLDLTRRRGVVELTRTHVDISFELHRVDMRIRRAGLDVDPGWVAWLARVVLFHYVDALPSTPT